MKKGWFHQAGVDVTARGRQGSRLDRADRRQRRHYNLGHASLRQHGDRRAPKGVLRSLTKRVAEASFVKNDNRSDDRQG